MATRESKKKIKVLGRINRQERERTMMNVALLVAFTLIIAISLTAATLLIRAERPKRHDWR
jgi:hypothetical protein